MCAGTLPGSWAQLPELKFLYIANNSLRGTLPARWATSFPKLDYFDLSLNSLSGEPRFTALPGLSSRLCRDALCVCAANVTPPAMASPVRSSAFGA